MDHCGLFSICFFSWPVYKPRCLLLKKYIFIRYRRAIHRCQGGKQRLAQKQLYILSVTASGLRQIASGGFCNPELAACRGKASRSHKCRGKIHVVCPFDPWCSRMGGQGRDAGVLNNKRWVVNSLIIRGYRSQAGLLYPS